MAALRQRAATGARAEALAAAYLQARGYRIVARNWRRPDCELDLVADHNGVCVFVEVRSRTNDDRGDALETLNARKRARVIRAARHYLQDEPTDAHSFRFDVVGITFPAGEGAPKLTHVEDAFRTS